MFNYFLYESCKKAPEAVYGLGICYERAIGVEQDLEKAVSCFNEAADLGSKLAKEHLAK